MIKLSLYFVTNKINKNPVRLLCFILVFLWITQHWGRYYNECLKVEYNDKYSHMKNDFEGHMMYIISNDIVLPK